MRSVVPWARSLFDRPLPVGSKPLSGDIRKVIKTARDAQLAALSAIRPGVMAGEVHAAAVAVVNRGGWTDPFLHRTGRGIGYSDWDGIELKAGAETVLKVGNVLSVEPGIYVNGIGGARFGDTVLVTETGYMRPSLRLILAKIFDAFISIR